MTKLHELHVENGLLQDVRYVPSSNCDDRPDAEQISLIVIHAISLPPNEFGGPHIDALFTNKLDVNSHPYFAEIADLRVSSHILINRTGEITQYVPFHKRAWHTGESVYNGRSCCNDFSIGIELEGTDTEPFTDVQYEILVLLLRALITTYPQLSRDTLTGHCDISPARKTDPGPLFDWARVNQMLAVSTETG